MKRILIGLSGSIAAYRIADLVSTLSKEGFKVQCLLTRSAREFVSPLVLETLSGNPVHSELWSEGMSGTEHIRLARWADLVLFAPATAHLIARLSLGLADDLITTVALATRAPWLIAPAMNSAMWENPVTQRHLQALRERGARIVEPDEGLLACREEGPGKLASVERLAQAIREATLSKPSAPHVLITAGPTLSRIDAVRYITNPSTGRMGVALAEEALSRGWRVSLVLGQDKGIVEPSSAFLHSPRLKLYRVETAEEMLEASLPLLPEVQAVIATAAVLDYRVASPHPLKQKRSLEPQQLELVPSVDVLGELRARAQPGQLFVGFAAETDNELAHARQKLERKRLDFLFVNHVARAGERAETGFGGDRNAGVLLTRDGRELELGPASKREIARRLLQELT